MTQIYINDVEKDREQGIRQYFVILIYAYYALNKKRMERFHKRSPFPKSQS